MGGFMSNLALGRPLEEGAPLDTISQEWGPSTRQGRGWLLVGGKGAAEWGGHYAIFVDVGGQSLYGDSGGEERIPSAFTGVIMQLGLFEKVQESKRMRIACLIAQAYNGMEVVFDHGLCEKIIPLNPRITNNNNSTNPRDWAYVLESLANDAFLEMTARPGQDDPTDETYQTLINEELDKANWKSRVDFTMPKEFQSKRWDSLVNCHVFASTLAVKLGFDWPTDVPIIPQYEGWLLDTILAAPGRKSQIDTLSE